MSVRLSPGWHRWPAGPLAGTLARLTVFCNPVDICEVTIEANIQVACGKSLPKAGDLPKSEPPA